MNVSGKLNSNDNLEASDCYIYLNAVNGAALKYYLFGAREDYFEEIQKSPSDYIIQSDEFIYNS